MTAAPIQMTNNIYSFPSRKIDSIGKGIQSFIANKIRIYLEMTYFIFELNTEIIPRLSSYRK
jgi:hypothetical protein